MDLQQLGLSAQDLYKMKPVKNSSLEMGGAPKAPNLTAELGAVSDCQCEELLFFVGLTFGLFPILDKNMYGQY